MDATTLSFPGSDPVGPHLQHHRPAPLLRGTVGDRWRAGPTPTPAGISPPCTSGRVAKWAKLAGIKDHRWDGVSAHALRHTAASDVLERSNNLQAVQEMLGHADLATTSIYLRRVAAGRLREAMEGRKYTTSLPSPGRRLSVEVV